jgi:ATP-dependent Clp protease ATP-binding subunit ClpC
VLDDGMLTDGKGRKVNFKNTIIIMTSNIGSQFVQKMESIGFHNNNEKVEYSQMKDKVEGALKDHFKPEFLNRIDEVVVFDILSSEAIKEIVGIRINTILARLQEKGIKVTVEDSALSYLARVGYNPQYGARPLNRLIQAKVLNPIAERIIKQQITAGDAVTVSVVSDDIVISHKNKKQISSLKKTGSTRKVQTL